MRFVPLSQHLPHLPHAASARPATRVTHCQVDYPLADSSRCFFSFCCSTSLTGHVVEMWNIFIYICASSNNKNE